MKKLYLSFIRALILSVIAILGLCLLTPGVRFQLIPFALFFGGMACFYTGYILHQPMQGYRRMGGGKALLWSGRVWALSTICLILLLTGIFFSTTYASPFPDDQTNQRTLGYSVLIGWVFGFAVTVLCWHQIGYSDHHTDIYICKLQGLSNKQINEGLRRGQRHGWYEPGDIYLSEDNETEENALPDRQG